MPQGKSQLTTEKVKFASRIWRQVAEKGSVAESTRGISQKGPGGGGQQGSGQPGWSARTQAAWPLTPCLPQVCKIELQVDFSPSLFIPLPPHGESSIRFCQTVFCECGLSLPGGEDDGVCHCPCPWGLTAQQGRLQPFEPLLDTVVRTTDSELWVLGLNAALLIVSSMI